MTNIIISHNFIQSSNYFYTTCSPSPVFVPFLARCPCRWPGCSLIGCSCLTPRSSRCAPTSNRNCCSARVTRGRRRTTRHLVSACQSVDAAVSTSPTSCRWSPISATGRRYASASHCWWTMMMLHIACAGNVRSTLYSVSHCWWTMMMRIACAGNVGSTLRGPGFTAVPHRVDLSLVTISSIDCRGRLHSYLTVYTVHTHCFYHNTILAACTVECFYGLLSFFNTFMDTFVFSIQSARTLAVVCCKD